MNPTADIETSVISDLTARPSRDVVVAAYQAVTREWWREAPHRFTLAASALVLTEPGAGDAKAARDRLDALRNVTLLSATKDSADLARELLEKGAIPRNAVDDAAHIAIAATNGVEYLVTWNFRHIANATMRSRIEQVCRQAGYTPPVICVPHELMEPDHANEED